MYEVIVKIRGGWWVLGGGLTRRDAGLIARFVGGFAQPEDVDDVCLPVVEWEV